MKTTTGEQIHTCGWLHPLTQPCPPPKRNVDAMGNSYYMPVQREAISQADGLGDETTWPEHHEEGL
jgi:hypothetical protein